MFVVFKLNAEYRSSLTFSKVFRNRGPWRLISELSLSSEGRCQGLWGGRGRRELALSGFLMASFGMDEIPTSASTPNEGRRKNRFAFIISWLGVGEIMFVCFNAVFCTPSLNAEVFHVGMSGTEIPSWWLPWGEHCPQLESSISCSVFLRSMRHWWAEAVLEVDAWSAAVNVGACDWQCVRSISVCLGARRMAQEHPRVHRKLQQRRQPASNAGGDREEPQCSTSCFLQSCELSGGWLHVDFEYR